VKQEKTAICITEQDESILVTFPRPCVSDTDLIARAAREIKKHIDARQPQKVIFDFEQVKFFSSQVLGMILETRACLKAWNGSVVISAIAPEHHRVFKITRLENILNFSKPPKYNN
jgi:anti-anti-sigma factor